MAAADVRTKLCTKCGETKLATEFGRARNGLCSWCRRCKSADQVARRAKNVEAHRAKERDAARSPERRRRVSEYGKRRRRSLLATDPGAGKRAYRAWYERAFKASPPVITCKDCSGVFCPLPGRRGKLIDRCPLCSDAHARQYKREKGKKRRLRVRMSRTGTCGTCGTTFCAYPYRKKFCSDQCRRASYTTHWSAKGRAASGLSPLKPMDIFARDGWRCKACGIDTPRRLRGTQDDRAPEIDHIVPVARGGSHASENTQCLCRRCNNLKGAQTMAEFMAKGYAMQKSSAFAF